VESTEKIVVILSYGCLIYEELSFVKLKSMPCSWKVQEKLSL